MDRNRTVTGLDVHKGTAMLLAGCSSAEPVSSSGCTPKLQNFRHSTKLWDKIIKFAPSSEVYRLEWSRLRHTQLNPTVIDYDIDINTGVLSDRFVDTYPTNK